jgi:hypothetical protein
LGIYCWKPGSLWIGNDAYLYYSGENGLKYRVPLQNVHSDAAAQKSSIWVEGITCFTRLVGRSTGRTGTTRTQTARVGTPMSRTPMDTPISRTGIRTRIRTRIRRTAIPMWMWRTVTSGTMMVTTIGFKRRLRGIIRMDRIVDNFTTSTSSHNDAHYDQHGISGQYFHGDEHFDTHSDGPHGDDHSDGSHGDAHNDVAHQDGSHGDGHSDTPHQDAAHSDGASSHYDIPRYIGP